MQINKLWTKMVVFVWQINSIYETNSLKKKKKKKYIIYIIYQPVNNKNHCSASRFKKTNHSIVCFCPELVDL